MKEAKGVKQRHRSDRRGPEGTGRQLQGRSTRTTRASDFPQDPKEQLIEAVMAVFRSWDNPRANVYRQMNEIPYELGHRRQRPADGLRQLRPQERHRRGLHPQPRHRREGAITGEYLINAQGEDVVAGVRTPSPHRRSCMRKCPRSMTQFVQIATRLENLLSRICRTWSSPSRTVSSICSRPATASAPLSAALKIAIDLVDEGMIDEDRGRAARGAQAAGHPAAPPV